MYLNICNFCFECYVMLLCVIGSATLFAASLPGERVQRLDSRNQTTMDRTVDRRVSDCENGSGKTL